MTARLRVALAFVALLLSAGVATGHAQEGIEGDVSACSDIGGGSVDVGTLVTVAVDGGQPVDEGTTGAPALSSVHRTAPNPTPLMGYGRLSSSGHDRRAFVTVVT